MASRKQLVINVADGLRVVGWSAHRYGFGPAAPHVNVDVDQGHSSVVARLTLDLSAETAINLAEALLKAAGYAREAPATAEDEPEAVTS